MDDKKARNWRLITSRISAFDQRPSLFLDLPRMLPWSAQRVKQLRVVICLGDKFFGDIF